MAESAQTVNEDLLDRVVHHQIGLQRLSTSTVRKIIAILNKVEPEIVGKLANFEPGARTEFARRRLEAILDAIREINQDAYNDVQRRLRSELIDLAEYEVEWQNQTIQTVVPVKIDVVTPTLEQLTAVVNSRPFQGAILKEWAEQLEASAFKNLRDAIRIGFTQGETIDQMVRRVRGTKARQYQDGILDLNRRNAEAVVRTAVNATSTAAREEIYDQNTDLIKGVKIVATIDMRTTPVCRAQDGRVYEVGKGPRPPFHYGCRTTTAPVVRSWKEMGIDIEEAPAGTRASMDGEVPADLTYGEWLKKQSRETVVDIMGKAKAKLFLDGNLPIDRFVDNRGVELTLQDLKAREAEAFKKAGLS